MGSDKLRLLAEGKISPAVDVYVVYRNLFHNEPPPESHNIYCIPDQFLSVTYVTPAFNDYLRDFLGKLTKGEPEVYVLPALLGSGKSHFLALLLHIIALYKRCNGVGQCVNKELVKYDLNINTPSIDKVPEVVVFHGQYNPTDLAETIRKINDKNELRKFLNSRAPIMLIFDETQYFENKYSDFVPWIQMLAEVVKEVRGAYLLVSFSLFPNEKPELGTPRALDAIRRINPINVGLDTVSNIVNVFRKWGGLTSKSVDLSSLKGAVNDDEYTNFEKKNRNSYPFNPVFLDEVLRLGEESIVERTHVQLTRELLRILAISYMNSKNEGLITFAHLPEPRDLIITGGELAAYWDALVKFYEDDKKKVEEKKLSNVVISVLRHIFLSTFLARLMPSETLYPSEDDLILGSFNGLDVRPLDIKNAIQDISENGLHVAKLGNKYLYWYIRDETDAIKEAMSKFSDEDSLQIATDEIASLVREWSRIFSAVYISGVGGPKSLNKIHIISNNDEWQKALENSDDSILAIDLLNFGVTKKRNNLTVVKRNDKANVKDKDLEVLNRFDSSSKAKFVKDAVISLGKIIKSIDEVKDNLYNYFPDILKIEKDELKKEMETLLQDRLNEWKTRIANLLKNEVYLWLNSVTKGFKDMESENLEKILSDIAKSKDKAIESLVEQIFEGNQINWDGFKKIGDLWSLYLNNDSFPYAPITFDEFRNKIKDYCGNCYCIFQVDQNYEWLTKDNCRVPQLNKDVALAPFIWKKEIVTSAVESFLKQLANQSGGSKRYNIVYRKPSGEIVTKSVTDLLLSRVDWIYLSEGHIEEEVVSKSVDIKINGLSTTVIEESPGSKVRIEVSASENLKSVRYKIDDLEKINQINGTSYSFEIELPKKPGEYKFELTAEFDDGSKDERSLLMKVSGKCVKEISAYSISVNDKLSRIESASIDAADKLLDHLRELVSHGYDFKFTLSVNQSIGDKINLSAEFEVSSTDKISIIKRLLRAFNEISPSIDAIVEFHKVVPIDSKIAEEFKGYSFRYIIERETEC